MQLKHLIPAFLLLTISISNPQKVHAAGAAGGEIIYQWVSDSTYRFFFALDQACGNGAEPNKVPICLFNPCSNTTISDSMSKWTGTPPVSTYTNKCPNIKTACDSVGSTIPGYKTFWYTKTITLPARCNSWKIFSYVAGRASSNNISNANNTTLYCEATLNNLTSLQNSSPFYNNRAMPATYQNFAFTVNYSVVDSDGDSLITEIIHPRTGISSCNDTAVNVTYAAMSPAINLPNNPFQTGSNNFTLNQTTGQHSFISTAIGGNTYTIRTKEYRNGVLIGSVMKEAQVQTHQNTGIIVPTVDTPNITATSWFNNQMNGCIGQPLTFSFNWKSSDSNAILVLSDNHNTAIPNANVTITNQGSDSVHYEFSWTPTANDVGLNNIIITIKDSTCNLLGIVYSYASNVPIYIWPATKAVNDTIINAGERALLGVTGGGNYTWTVLSGTANSLNIANIANPIAMPDVTTTYQVSSGATSFCNNNKDTITVSVRPPHIGTAGGEIIYEHLADSTYRFFVKLYQDCANGAAPDSIPICLTDTCNNTTLSYLMPKWQGSIGGPTPHSGSNLSCGTKTTCDSIGAIVPGYKVGWYHTIVTLPSKCNSWKASTYISGRNSNSENILNPSSSSFYLEAIFNNTISNNNSSPYYSIGSIPYTFTNTTTTYNAGAIDVDGDSLVTEVIHPLTGVANCSDTPVSVTYRNISPAISIPSNPFQTGTNNFSLNPTTGFTSFTSTVAGRNSYAIRTKEYRNGTLIGSVMKEIQVQSFAGQAPTSNNLTVGCGITMPTNSNPLDLCIGKPISFCFSIVTTDTNAILFVSDNLSSVAPGATITYTGQGSNLINGTFNWTPTAATAGISNIALVILDSTCRPPGLLRYDNKLIPFRVWPKTNAGPDLLICPGESTMLNATGGGFYNWSILSGTPNSLSNTTIANPIATPTTTTTYTVVSNLNSFCANNKDTITVDIRPSSMVTRPSININVLPDSNITQGTSVTFTAKVTNCNHPSYQWTSMGIKLPGATDSSFVSNTIFDYQSITCLLHCDDTCSTPRDTFSNAITMRIPTSIIGFNKLNNKDITLFPNPNNGTFIIKLNKDVSTTQSLHVEIVNAVGQVVHQQQLNAKKNSITDEVSIQNLPYGVYLLKLSTPTGLHTTRFVIED